MTTYYELYFPKNDPLDFSQDIKEFKNKVEKLFLLFETRLTEPEESNLLQDVEITSLFSKLQRDYIAQTQWHPGSQNQRAGGSAVKWNSYK